MHKNYDLEREYLGNDEIIDFSFEQNEIDFVVDEIALVEFKNNGKYLILQVQKVGMTTWDMVATFAKFLNLNAQDIGYAGLKDKHATTTQYISVDAKYEKAFKKFHHKKIKILKYFKYKNPIKMGDLKSNRFGINLHDVSSVQAAKIEKKLLKIEKHGMANYFGYQRFGRNDDSIEQAMELVDGTLHIADSKLKHFLYSVYQSVRFNEWLKERILLSKKENNEEFLLLAGDVYADLNDRLFTPKQTPLNDFHQKKVLPTGLLCGRNVFRSRDKAREIESKHDDEYFHQKGLRRAAIVYPTNVQSKYYSKQKTIHLSFVLPKGSYATVLLENIANRNLQPKKLQSKNHK